MLMTIDLFPTIAKLIHADLPKHRIDGLDVWPIISGQPGEQKIRTPLTGSITKSTNSRRSYRRRPLETPTASHVSHTRWTPGRSRRLPVPYENRKLDKSELYDLVNDISETTDLSDEHPEIVKSLEAEAEKARTELGDNITKRIGAGIREPGRVEVPE